MLSHITKGIVNEKHDYAINRTKYRLGNTDVIEILKVDGTVRGGPFVFQKNTDYRLGGSTLEWTRDGEKPDDRTPFFVNYRLDAPQGITDVNPGSVTRTVVESAAREIDYLYAQMDHVYNAGFIDTATGKSLDLVVSILGVTRKVAEPARGDVTFARVGEPKEVEVSREAHVYDTKEKYRLRDPMIKAVKKVEGTSGGVQTEFAQGKDYSISGSELSWLEGGRRPEKMFYLTYSKYEEIRIPVDTRVSTYSARAGNVKVFRTTREAALVRNAEGHWEADVPIEAMSPGKEGNVFAGSINVMPKPVMGIEYVINKKDILNGREAESDTELRERAKRALEMAGKATLNSLKAAVEGVKGVIGEVKVVDQPDGIPGIIKIIASGGDENEILRVIEDTRAAGVKVEFNRPATVPLDIRLTIFVVESVNRDEVRKEADAAIRQYIEALAIDDDVVLSRIIKSVLGVQGIRDVRDVTINDRSENIEVRFDEKGELRSLEIFVGD